jgi:hypothetical protein
MIENGTIFDEFYKIADAFELEPALSWEEEHILMYVIELPDKIFLAEPENSILSIFVYYDLKLPEDPRDPSKLERKIKEYGVDVLPGGLGCDIYENISQFTLLEAIEYATYYNADQLTKKQLKAYEKLKAVLKK